MNNTLRLCLETESSKRTCRSEEDPSLRIEFCSQKFHSAPPLLKEQIDNGVLEYEILLMNPVDVE